MAFARSFETSTIFKALMERAEKDNHEIMSYEFLSGLCGKDVRDQCRSALYSAMNAARNETGKLFVVIPKEGVRLATLDDQKQVGISGVTAARRHANRTLKKLGCVEYGKLDHEAQVMHNVSAAQLGAIHLVTKRKSSEKLAALAQNNVPQLEDTLKLFTKT